MAEEWGSLACSEIQSQWEGQESARGIDQQEEQRARNLEIIPPGRSK